MRTLVLFFVFLCALMIRKNLNNFIGFVGSVVCTPLIVIVPCLLDYKLCAKTSSEKVKNIVLILSSFYVMYLCVYVVIQNW